MTTLYEGSRPGEFILSEANGQRSRETITIPANQTIPANSLIQQTNTADEEEDPVLVIGAYDPDSEGEIIGIAIYGVATGAGETAQVAAIARDAEVNGHCIAWPEGTSDEQKATAAAGLAEIGIIVRN